MSANSTYNVRLILTTASTIATAIAVGNVTFEALGSTVGHDVGSIAQLVALGCNTWLWGMATKRDA